MIWLSGSSSDPTSSRLLRTLEGRTALCILTAPGGRQGSVSNQESPTSAHCTVALPGLLSLPSSLGAQLEGIFSDSEGGAAALSPA